MTKLVDIKYEAHLYEHGGQGFRDDSKKLDEFDTKDGAIEYIKKLPPAQGWSSYKVLELIYITSDKVADYKRWCE